MREITTGINDFYRPPVTGGQNAPRIQVIETLRSLAYGNFRPEDPNEYNERTQIFSALAQLSAKLHANGGNFQGAVAYNKVAIAMSGDLHLSFNVESLECHRAFFEIQPEKDGFIATMEKSGVITDISGRPFNIGRVVIAGAFDAFIFATAN